MKPSPRLRKPRQEAASNELPASNLGGCCCHAACHRWASSLTGDAMIEPTDEDVERAIQDALHSEWPNTTAAILRASRSSRNMWRNENVKKQTACEQMGARITALEAERDRMEDALRDIMDRFDLEDCELTQDARTARDIAQAALKETGHE
jgi:hypothetical protein